MSDQPLWAQQLDEIRYQQEEDTRLGILRVEVLGPAATAGSKTLIRNTAGKVVGTRDSNKRSYPWRQDMRAMMVDARSPGFAPWDVAVEATLTLYVLRPKSHYGTGARCERLKANAPEFPPTGLDLDKVARCCGDAMKGIWLKDDARISKWTIERLYCLDGEVERTVITCKVRV
jgi:hypothetical protein